MTGQTKTTKKKSISRWKFSILQNGEEQASVEGSYEQAGRQAEHYAFIYGQDGPVEVKEVKLYD